MLAASTTRRSPTWQPRACCSSADAVVREGRLHQGRRCLPVGNPAAMQEIARLRSERRMRASLPRTEAHGALDGKTAFITGAGSGIGRGTAECLAQEGADSLARVVGEPGALRYRGLHDPDGSMLYIIRKPV